MNSVQHFEIAAADTDRAKKFYSDLFGWKFIDMPDMPYWMIHTAETDDNMMVKENGAINGGMFKKEDANGPVVVITVEDTESHLNKIVEAGGEKVFGPQQVGDFGIYAQFRDPEGNLMGLWQTLKG